MPDNHITERLAALEQKLTEQDKKIEHQDKAIERLNNRYTNALQKNLGLESVSQSLVEALRLSTASTERQQHALQQLVANSRAETEADLMEVTDG